MIKAVIFDMFETLITHYECPLYFSEQMAEDAGISLEKFKATWRGTELERTIGKISFEEVIGRILRENQCYSKELLEKIVAKRVATKEECFRQLHSEIIPMLVALKENGIRIGLITNCFSEEVEVIRKSELFPYFDVLCFSYERGLAKPDEQIFYNCMEELVLKPKECMYVGDGGSQELETAKRIGMHALQAVWYLKDGTMQQVGRKAEFGQLERPMDVLKYF